MCSSQFELMNPLIDRRIWKPILIYILNISIFQNNSIVNDPPERFTIQNVTYDDAGWYTCVAANYFGVTCASAYLTVSDGEFSIPSGIQGLQYPLKNYNLNLRQTRRAIARKQAKVLCSCWLHSGCFILHCYFCSIVYLSEVCQVSEMNKIL